MLCSPVLKKELYLVDVYLMHVQNLFSNIYVKEKKALDYLWLCPTKCQEGGHSFVVTQTQSNLQLTGFVRKIYHIVFMFFCTVVLGKTEFMYFNSTIK